jgi:hypothetical protein
MKENGEHLKELDRNVGETEVDQTDADQTDANPGTDYKDICRATQPEDEINERERLLLYSEEISNCRTRTNVLAQCSLDLTVYHNRHTRLIALLVF